MFVLPEFLDVLLHFFLVLLKPSAALPKLLLLFNDPLFDIFDATVICPGRDPSLFEVSGQLFFSLTPL